MEADFSKVDTRKDLLSLYGIQLSLLLGFKYFLSNGFCRFLGLSALILLLMRSPSSGEFQGPALLAILEGATLTREEVCSLQLLSQWRVKGETLNYGLGLLSCFFMCDLLSIVSGGNFYMFDPQGATLSASTTQAPAAKMFSLIGMNV